MAKKAMPSLITRAEFRELFKSAVFRLWLKKSLFGFLSMAAHIVFMIYFLEPTVRFFFPPKSVSLFGLIEIRPQGAEAWEKIVRILDPLFWIAGVSLFFAYLESRVRPALEEAHQEER
ncbi:MAG TPA: hypothetical protein VI382_04380 [Candidatus Manganitrophaceae bacterium]|nr:hypothetical protein [Candidatus Manganitrophaceae bacterium]